MIQQKATLLLQKLTCLQEGTDGNTHDQTYITITIDGVTARYPQRADTWPMNSGDSANVDLEIEVDYLTELVVGIWDTDDREQNDHYGDITISRHSELDANMSGYQEMQQQNGPVRYGLSYRVLTDPIPTVRILGIRCEKESAGMNVDLCNQIVGVAETCCDKAAEVIGTSPRPTSTLISEAFEAASVVLQAIGAFAEWLADAIEGPDDITMRHATQGASSVGKFFPDGKEYEEMTAGEEIYFDDEYFRFPADQGPVTIEIWENDLVGDIIVGSLVIEPQDLDTYANDGVDGGSPSMSGPVDGEDDTPAPIEGGTAVMDGPAVVEIANAYYGKSNGEGAIYHLCYSIGMEDWCRRATEADQASRELGNYRVGSSVNYDAALNQVGGNLPSLYDMQQLIRNKYPEANGWPTGNYWAKSYGSMAVHIDISTEAVTRVDKNAGVSCRFAYEDGGKVYTYQDTGFNPDNGVLTIDLDDSQEGKFVSLHPDGLSWWDCISSMKWRLAPGIKVTFYSDTGGGGRTYTISGNGEEADLRDVGFNDDASSFKWYRG